MPLNIPTTQEITDRNLSNLESALGQNTPIAPKAFLNVLAAMEAMGYTDLYKFLAERTKQVLAITAFGAGLDTIGSEYGVIRKPAEAAVFQIIINGIPDTIIPATVDFVGDANNVRYSLSGPVTIGAPGFSTPAVTAQTLGVVGNLLGGDTTVIGTQVAGIENAQLVSNILNIGTETESDDAYRNRILTVIRATPGGGNAVDHKIWAEAVSGVERAYPYSGRPDGSPPGLDTGSAVPADRAIWIESTTAINQDGIPPSSLLDEVRDNINNDPVTGASRPPLGLTDSTLYVEPIVRTELFVLITNFDEGTGSEIDIKADIETALTQYFLSLRMFVVAIDIPSERNDLITEVTLSAIVQGILDAGDASAESVEFGLATTVPSPLANYELDAGELVKLGETGGITYA